MSNILLTPTKLGSLSLRNRVVMAPMTRSRASAEGVQPAFVADYYAQRASAGLLISEAIAVAKQGSGYVLIPGLWNEGQTNSWKPVTDAVHAQGGKIFAQLFHTGRISHSTLSGTTPVAPSAIAPTGEVMGADFANYSFETPRALETSEIAGLVESFRIAALHAREAGFDGIELHAANGYIIDQFLRDGSNQRTDSYGGSVINRARLLLEIIAAVTTVWRADQVGVRFSPTSPFNSMTDSDPLGHFTEIVELISPLGLAYLHLIDPVTSENRSLQTLSKAFEGKVIANGGYTKEAAITDLEADWAQAIAFGVPYISNPDLVERLQANAELAPADPAKFYGGGQEGYTNYPALSLV